MTRPRKIVHLLSGGLDSVTLLYDLHAQGNKVHCLLVDYKQPHVQELEWAKLHCHRLGVLFTTVTLPQLGGMKDNDWVVPNRNAILLSIGVNLAIQRHADWVTIACNADDTALFQDCRLEFFDSFQQMLRVQELGVLVQTPYLRWSKAKVARRSADRGIQLHETWSCYRGGTKPCRQCPACVTLEAACGR